MKPQNQLEDLVDLPKLLNDDNVLNIYRFGSVVYGTTDSKSDEDYIIIVKEYKPINSIDIHDFTIEDFNLLYTECDIQILECMSLDINSKDLVPKHTYTVPKQDIDLNKLRVAISTVTNHSWVKGKKKLCVMADYDCRAAIKSVFHSVRILDYGIQIAKHGKIIDYKNSNFILDELLGLSNKYRYISLWNQIDSKYRQLHNSLKSEFKLVAPLQKVNKKDGKNF